MQEKNYSFANHLHNYAVWTAARAVQRSFTSTKKIKAAIDYSTLRQFAESTESCTKEKFDENHSMWADQLIEGFQTEGIENVSYGRAAKIISIYLKTSVVLPNKAACNRSEIIHAPIDNILLTALAEAKPKFKKEFRLKWTLLKKEDYWKLINDIESAGEPINWRLEKYWRPEQDKIENQEL